MELFQPEWGLAFWMLVVFLLLCFVLGRYAWPVILRSMEDRAELIDSGVTFAQEARQELEHARTEAGRIVSDAQKQQLEILQTTGRLKAEMLEKARSEAEEAARKIRQNARIEVEQALREAEGKIRSEIYRYALLVSEKLLRRQLSDDAEQAALIDSMIDEIEQQEKKA